MPDFFDTLEEIRREMLEAQMSPAELATHEIASRVNSLLSELDDMILLSRSGPLDSQNAIASEWRNLDCLATKAMFLASFGEVRQRPVGLRMIRGRK